jgi:two-component system response regulator DevR
VTARHFYGQRPIRPCEQDILDRLCEGKSNKEIANERGTSPHTVKRQLEDIYVKMGVANRTEAAVMWVKKRGVIY